MHRVVCVTVYLCMHVLMQNLPNNSVCMQVQVWVCKYALTYRTIVLNMYISVNYYKHISAFIFE